MSSNLIGLLFQSTLGGFLCEFFLLIFILADRSFPKATINGFISAVVFAFLLSTTDTIEFFCDGLKVYPKLKLFVGSLGYIFRVGAACYIVRISQRKNKLIYNLITGLFIVTSIISIFNLKTGYLFSVSSDYVITPGKLFDFPYIVMGFATFVFLHSAITNIRTNLGESLIIFAIIFACIVANTHELFFNIKFILSQVYAVCIVFYFLCLNVELYQRDALTDLFNRRSFHLYLQKNKNKKMIILSMDLNNLKKYNDTFGHEAGDLAIKTSAECMLSAFKKIGIVYRTGGDEFMAIFKEKSPQAIENAISIFREELSKTEYEVACGYALYSPGDDVESVIKQADAAMYENKKTLKGPSRE